MLQQGEGTSRKGQEKKQVKIKGIPRKYKEKVKERCKGRPRKDLGNANWKYPGKAKDSPRKEQSILKKYVDNGHQ